MAQKDLGEMANVSRPRVNRVLRDFVKNGWISQEYQRIRILDASALREFSAMKA